MTRRSFVAVIAVAGSLFFTGCGKPAELKKLESDLNDQIMKGHEAQMAKISQADDLLAVVNAAIAAHDSLATLFPTQTAEHGKSDLLSAKNRLDASKEAMESWMSNFQPYNEGIKHELAMAQMKGEWDTLVQAGQQMDSAIADATAALAAHKAFAGGIAAPAPKGKHK